MSRASSWMGLGILNIYGINRAALIRQVWWVIRNHPTCWNLWVHEKYLCQKTLWDVKYSKSASWGWRGILSLWYLVLPYIRHLIGDSIELLNFGWILECKMDTFRDIYSPPIIYDLGLGKSASVSQFISPAEWILPSPISRDLITLWAKIRRDSAWTIIFRWDRVNLEEHENLTLKSGYAMVVNLRARCAIP